MHWRALEFIWCIFTVQPVLLCTRLEEEKMQWYLDLECLGVAMKDLLLDFCIVMIVKIYNALLLPWRRFYSRGMLIWCPSIVQLCTVAAEHFTAVDIGGGCAECFA